MQEKRLTKAEVIEKLELSLWSTFAAVLLFQCKEVEGEKDETLVKNCSLLQNRVHTIRGYVAVKKC